MTHTTGPVSGHGPSHRSMEIAVAIGTLIFSLVVIYGSVLAGIGWGDEGPRAGFFPLYIGLFILVSSVINLISGLLTQYDGKLFAEWGQLRQVISVIIPTAIYVALIPSLGIYITSMALIAIFMRWLGRYRWDVLAAVSIGVPILLFLMFERWFLVSLPKGPIETLLGF